MYSRCLSVEFFFFKVDSGNVFHSSSDDIRDKICFLIKCAGLLQFFVFGTTQQLLRDTNKQCEMI